MNLGHQEIQLPEGLILGQFQPMPDEEIKVTQEDLFGVNATEPWVPDELEEEVLKGNINAAHSTDLGCLDGQPRLRLLIPNKVPRPVDHVIGLST